MCAGAARRVRHQGILASSRLHSLRYQSIHAQQGEGRLILQGPKRAFAHHEKSKHSFSAPYEFHSIDTLCQVSIMRRARVARQRRKLQQGNSTEYALPVSKRLNTHLGQIDLGKLQKHIPTDTMRLEELF